MIALDGLIDFFDLLMDAADYLLLPSLWEPHGGCFAGRVVPIIRAVCGLIAQVALYQPTGLAATLNAFWHGSDEVASGLGFREEEASVADLLQLSDNVAHVPGGHELALFHIDRASRSAGCLE